jgi:shikimate dehydrogenase
MKPDAHTVICGIIGKPVSHSLSPIMHNAGYKALDINYVYLAFDITNAKDAVSAMRTLSMRGLSVTIPHKISVMQYLDQIDPQAKKIGAVNTIVNDSGTLIGFNTDSDAALRALEEKTSISGKKVVLLGTGGAARAIAFGLQEKKANVLILGRNSQAARMLAAATGAKHGNIAQMDEIKTSDILIHATSIGMHPHLHESIVPTDVLHKNLTVFDIVYTPRETKLILDAKRAGSSIVYGHTMLLHQAMTQFKLFTGVPAPMTIFKKVLLKNLKG